MHSCLASIATTVLMGVIATPVAAQDTPADQRRVFFGELHLHTSLSLDAWTYGTKLLPEDAYRFGRGETVMVPATQVAREQGMSRRARKWLRSAPGRSTSWP